MVIAKATNRLIISLPNGLRRRVVYLRAHHRLLSLRHPVRFTEKVNWRMVYDRRAVMVTACDKQAMKRYAAERVGPDRLRVPRTLWSGRHIDELTEIPLPDRWVLKPNAGTGQVHVGSGVPDLDVLRPLAAHWLSDRGLARWGEWGYRNAERALLVEEHVGAPGADLWDWKFFVFGGTPLVVQVDSGRLGEHRRRLYTPGWEPLPHRCEVPLAPVTAAPAQLPEMLRVAAEIGAAFDHIRVDLYLAGGEIWFGEITPYSGSGVVGFDPDDLDVTLGQAWVLPTRSGRGWRRTVVTSGRPATAGAPPCR